MNILFVHQNMPGQYRELLQWFAAQGSYRIYFLTQRKDAPHFPGVETRVYTPHRTPAKDAYGLSKVWEEAAGTGYGAAMAARQLEGQEGFVPDIVIGHAGWGELTFFKPDETRCPATRLAREAAEAGGAAPAVLNAANEIAVAAFLAGKIKFSRIALMVESVLSENSLPAAPQTLEEVLRVDAEARRRASAIMETA